MHSAAIRLCLTLHHADVLLFYYHSFESEIQLLVFIINTLTYLAHLNRGF